MKHSQILRTLGAIAFLYIFSTGGRAQQHNLPPPPNTYDWAPDCSNESGPIFPMPNGKVNLHRYTPDNTGTPRMDPAAPLTYNAWQTTPLLDQAMDAVADLNFVSGVTEDAPGNVWQDAAGAAHYVGNNGQITAWRIDNTTNTVWWKKVISDGLGKCSLPKIVQNSPTTSFIAYKETVTGGDDLVVQQIDNSGSLISTTTLGPLSRIDEFSLSPDNAGGVGIAIREGTTIVRAQRINTTGVAIWAGGAPATLQISAVGGLTNKFNPLVNFNPITGLYEYFWGDDFAAPSPLVAQTITAGGALGYPVGGQPDFGTRVGRAGFPMPFYVKTCAGLGGILPDLGETVILYTDCNFGAGGAPGILTMKGLVMNGGGFPGAWLFGVFGVGFPCGITANPINPLVSDPVGVGFVPGGNVVVAQDINNITSAASFTSGSAAIALNSTRFKSMVDINASGIFIAIPGRASENLFRIDPVTGAFSAATTVAVRSVTTLGTLADAYFAACLNPARVSIMNFEYGQQVIDVTGYFKDFDLGTGDAQRENFMPNTDYDFLSYATNAVGPFFTGLQTIGLEDPIVHHAPHSSVWQTLRATAFESFNQDGTNDLLLGYRIGTTGPDQPPIVIETATNNRLYIRPKCSVVYDAINARNIAIVTYEVSNVTAGAKSATYNYKLINLDTRSTVASGVLDGPTFHPTNSDDFQNWDVVFDPTVTAFLFVYGKGYMAGGHQIKVAGFNFAGAPLWGGVQLVSGFAGVPKQEVRACFNPDPLNTGAYIVWREGNYAFGNGIGLTAILTATGLTWGAWPYMHAPALGTGRRFPVVCAGPTWVLAAWQDWQGGPNPLIYGCAHTNLTALQPGWIVNGNLLSTPVGAGYEARMPDLITNPSLPNTGLLAYEQDNDPSQINFFASPRQIDVSNVSALGYAAPLATPIPMPAGIGLSFPPGFVATDAVNSMFGFQMRRPKLVAESTPAVDLGLTPFGVPYVMCAFETEAYPIVFGSHPYVDIRNEEIALTGIEPQYSQGNISAELIDPTSFQRFAWYSIARNTNAQTLQGAYWTNDQQFVVAYSDYVGSDNHNGIVKTVDANLEVREYNDFASYGAAWTGLFGVSNIYTYNNSLIPYRLDGDLSSTTCLLAPPNTWAYTGGMGLIVPANSTNTITIQYNPHKAVTKNNDDLISYLSVSTVDNLIHPMPAMTLTVSGPAGTGTYKTGRPSSASDVQNITVELSQNPTNGFSLVHITGPANHAVNVRIYDMLGREVGTHFLEGNSSGKADLPLDLTTLAAGSYVILAQGDEGLMTKTMLSLEK
jgi:hypothetical protein